MRVSTFLLGALLATAALLAAAPAANADGHVCQFAPYPIGHAYESLGCEAIGFLCGDDTRSCDCPDGCRVPAWPIRG